MTKPTLNHEFSSLADDLINFAKHPVGQTLEFKKYKSFPITKLPFVAPNKDKPGYCFWSVPQTGGYIGGSETGRALAFIYLKHLKETGGGYTGRYLPSIVLDMLNLADCDNEADIALHGQIIGFFWELERWLIGAAKNLSGKLESFDNDSLLTHANYGLAFNESEYLAYLDQKGNKDTGGSNE